MSGLNSIRDAAVAAGLRFLLIGGNAMIAYGVQRETADLDLLVRREDRKSTRLNSSHSRRSRMPSSA